MPNHETDLQEMREAAYRDQHASRCKAEPADFAQQERIAAYSHEAWGRWMSHLFSCGEHRGDGSFLIPRANVERWERQMSTLYADLPEQEKASDRNEAWRIDRLYQELSGTLPTPPSVPPNLLRWSDGSRLDPDISLTFGDVRALVALLSVNKEASELVRARQDQLAAYCHEAFGRAVRWAFAQGKDTAEGTTVLYQDAIELLHRTVTTPYAELPDLDQARFRDEAGRLADRVRGELSGALHVPSPVSPELVRRIRKVADDAHNHPEDCKLAPDIALTYSDMKTLVAYFDCRPEARPPAVTDLEETLASDAHRSWCGWMRHLFSKSAPAVGGALLIPAGLVERWQEKIETSYADLPETDAAKIGARAEACRAMRRFAEVPPPAPASVPEVPPELLQRIRHIAEGAAYADEAEVGRGDGLTVGDMRTLVRLLEGRHAI